MQGKSKLATDVLKVVSARSGATHYSNSALNLSRGAHTSAERRRALELDQTTTEEEHRQIDRNNTPVSQLSNSDDVADDSDDEVEVTQRASSSSNPVTSTYQGPPVPDFMSERHSHLFGMSAQINGSDFSFCRAGTFQPQQEVKLNRKTSTLSHEAGEFSPPMQRVQREEAEYQKAQAEKSVREALTQNALVPLEISSGLFSFEFIQFQIKVQTLHSCLLIASRENTLSSESEKNQAKALFKRVYPEVKESVEESLFLKSLVTNPVTEEGRLMEGWMNQWVGHNGLKDPLQSVVLAKLVGKERYFSVAFIINYDWNPEKDNVEFRGDWLTPVCTLEQSGRDFQKYLALIQMPLKNPEKEGCQAHTQFVARIPKAALEESGLSEMILMRGKAEFLQKIEYKARDERVIAGVPAGLGGGEGLMLSDKNGSDAAKLRELVGEHVCMITKKTKETQVRWRVKNGNAQISERVELSTTQTLRVEPRNPSVSSTGLGIFGHSNGCSESTEASVPESVRPEPGLRG